MLRHVDRTSALVWVETARPAIVRVLDATANTFTVHGHHYALVTVDGLEPGTSTPYTVEVDGERMAGQPWWRRRITGGIAAYWLYQHVGNLSPAERAADPVLAAVSEVEGDAGEVLDEFAWRADQDPASYRWSFTRDHGPARLVMIDSRCGRVLDPEKRSIVDDAEWGLDRRPGPRHRARRAPAHRHVAAVPAAAAPGHRPGALGGVRPVLRRDGQPGDGGRDRVGRAAAADDRLPLRPRGCPLRARVTGPAACTSWSARRCATR